MSEKKTERGEKILSGLLQGRVTSQVPGTECWVENPSSSLGPGLLSQQIHFSTTRTPFSTVVDSELRASADFPWARTLPTRYQQQLANSRLEFRPSTLTWNPKAELELASSKTILWRGPKRCSRTLTMPSKGVPSSITSCPLRRSHL